MTNEAQLFYDEVREKSITARSAHNKARRTPKGSSGLMPNGCEYNCSLNKPIDYQDFKKLSRATQKRYLEGIITKYEVGPYVVNQVMGCSGTTIAKICTELGIKVPSYTPRSKREAFIKDFADGKIERPATTSSMKVNMMSVTLLGAFDPSYVTEYLSKMIKLGERVRVDIAIEKMETGV